MTPAAFLLPATLLPYAGVTQIDRVVEAVEETLRGNTVSMLAKKALPRLDLPKVRTVQEMGGSSLGFGIVGSDCGADSVADSVAETRGDMVQGDQRCLL